MEQLVKASMAARSCPRKSGGHAEEGADEEAGKTVKAWSMVPKRVT